MFDKKIDYEDFQNKKDSWISTYTGKKVNVFYPAINSIDIEDIAHALSMKCRFNGHTNKFYSVAEHSILVSLLIYDIYKDCIMSLKGLLHDAAEAYLPDISRPIKKHTNDLNSVEYYLLKIIFCKYNLDFVDYHRVMEIDSRLCLTEAILFMKDTSDWILAKKVVPLTSDDFRNIKGFDRGPLGLRQKFAKELFIDLFNNLNLINEMVEKKE